MRFLPSKKKGPRFVVPFWLMSGVELVEKVLHARHWQATKELRELWIVIGAVSETTLASTWPTFVDFAEITARLTRFKTLIWVGVMLIFVAWQV